MDPEAVARAIVRAGDSAAVVSVSREPEPAGSDRGWQKYRLSPMATVELRLPADALADPDFGDSGDEHQPGAGGAD